MNHQRLYEDEIVFYRSLKLENGSFKTTLPDRFADIDRATLRFVEHLPPPVAILDAAVSSGVTTADWCDFLEQSGIDFEMVATDLTVNGTSRNWGRFFTVLEQNSGYPLQFVFCRLTIENWLRGRRDLLRFRFVPLMLLRLFHKAMRAFFLSYSDTREISFISSRLNRRRQRITIVEDDLFVHNREFEKAFDVIRVGNILNKSYFTEQQLRSAIDNLKTYLRNNGLLLVIRTNRNAINEASGFRLNDRGVLENVFTSNGGSEIAGLIE